MAGSRNLQALAGWIALCFGAAATGAFVSIDGWYADLAKPAWNPPPWVFGPVWSMLYLMMAVAAWRVWSLGGFPARKRPLTLFLVQLALNALWTPLFFGLHQPGLALFEIILLWLAIVATLRAFHRIDRPAAFLLLPYLAWVTFATVLNAALWQMNR
jgi:benzodiazapine receptor